MPSLPLASTHSQTTSGVACHNRLWGPHRIERFRALHAIIAFGQHTRSDDVGRGMTSPPFDNTLDQQRRQAWHAMIPFGQHRQSNGVRRGMPSSPLDGKHGRTTSGVACINCLLVAQMIGRVRHCMLSSPLASTHSQTTLGVACHHLL